MKKTIILLTLSVLVFGCCNNQKQVLPQTSEADVAAAVDKLFKAFVNVDENVLKSITVEELVYAHSGGKVQNKSEFIAEILSKDPLTYISIEPVNQTIQIAGDVAIVRHIFDAETRLLNGSPGSLHVGNTLVWKFQDGEWKLLLRQAYRIQ